MNGNVQDIASRIESKVTAIVGRQTTLAQRVEAERAANRRLRARVEELEAELARLSRENEYLTMMRAVTVTPEQAERSRSMLAGLVREIDRCIADLKAC